MEQLHSLSALDDEGLLTRLGRRVSSVGGTLCNTQFCGITVSVCTSMQTDECERFGEGYLRAITSVPVIPCALSCNQLVTLHSCDRSNNALELYPVLPPLPLRACVDGRVPSGATAVQDAHPVGPFGLQRGGPHHRVHVVSAERVLPPQGGAPSTHRQAGRS